MPSAAPRRELMAHKSLACSAEKERKIGPLVELLKLSWVQGVKAFADAHTDLCPAPKGPRDGHRRGRMGAELAPLDGCNAW